jgi:hypothetical protein
MLPVAELMMEGYGMRLSLMFWYTVEIESWRSFGWGWYLFIEFIV